MFISGKLRAAAANFVFGSEPATTSAFLSAVFGNEARSVFVFASSTWSAFPHHLELLALKKGECVS